MKSLDATEKKTAFAGLLKHNFHNPFKVTWQLLVGKTLIRALFNLSVSKFEVSGRILDLGSKDGKGSYYSHLKFASGSETVYTDLEPGKNIVQVNVEEPFDIESETFDTVMSFHLFEHVFHFQNAPAEVYRILRGGGRFYFSIPFMHEYHADADDYFRWTDSGIYKIWSEAGFRCVHMEAIGYGPITACLAKLPRLCWPFPGKNILTAAFFWVGFPFDLVLSLSPKVDGKSVAQRFALEHFAIFLKPK